MSDKAWKAYERRLAKRLGGERVPITGRIRGSAPDVKNSWLSIEAKFRKQLPAWLFDAMDQAVKSIRGEQLPIVVLHQSGTRTDNDFVVLRLKDFEDWFCNDG